MFIKDGGGGGPDFKIIRICLILTNQSKVKTKSENFKKYGLDIGGCGGGGVDTCLEELSYYELITYLQLRVTI